MHLYGFSHMLLLELDTFVQPNCWHKTNSACDRDFRAVCKKQIKNTPTLYESMQNWLISLSIVPSENIFMIVKYVSNAHIFSGNLARH